MNFNPSSDRGSLRGIAEIRRADACAAPAAGRRVSVRRCPKKWGVAKLVKITLEPW